MVGDQTKVQSVGHRYSGGIRLQPLHGQSVNNFSAADSRLDANAMGYSFPFSSLCDKTAPSPKGEASHASNSDNLVLWCTVPEKMSTTFLIPGKPSLHPLTISMLLPSVRGHAAVPTLSLDLEGIYCSRSAFQGMPSTLILLVVSVHLKWSSHFPPWGVIHLCRFDVLDTPQNPS